MGFAHRGLHGPGVPENSLAAFRAALDIGAGIECDVRLSGDGQVMVFHDHDLRRLCASALAVESTPAATLAAQKLYDSGEHIPRLSEMLDLVAGRVPLLVEVKCRGGNAAQVTAAVVAQLNGYPGPVGVMSFEPSVGRWLARHEPQVRRGLVISGRAGAFDRWRSIRSASPHFLAVDFGALTRTWVQKARRGRWVYSWTIRSPDQGRTGEVHADALIWEGDGRPGA
ncbi:glycerophosphodiester phosphodiesterase [Sphingomonas sp. NSE70-1]|uniref:Glycerophosphodiester phosphodiesterase n=1 Tax=Sphingomonas caseinilyticus TaxID=2908205 RepID=A0ABT0RUQ7_9SPHN|nr:glycerophosphodiester phosphodiesterase family protein [Sphingomonas caseinilyticus]MCL6698724.1 glycerophosphodiester phosphodiesterase [Sphingomonas caseinilyticus]